MTRLLRVGPRLVAIFLVFVMLVAAGSAEAQRRRRRRRSRGNRVRVTVVDIAGTQAFVRPGRARGLRVGQEVRFGTNRFRIVSVASESAVLSLGEDLESARGQLEEGARGVVQVPRAAAREGGAEPAEQGFVAPPGLESFAGLWGPAVRPASEQDPAHVPIGRRTREERLVDLAASLGGLLYAPIGEGDVLSRLVARVRLHTEPIRETPFRIDVDAQAQIWLGQDVGGRAGSSSRPYVVVRRLEFAYGADASVALGRLRRVASYVGTLDGLRVKTPTWSGFSLSAFGGLMPDPDSGVPNYDVGRFGIEARYQNDEHPWRPAAALVAHGSVFGGIDERRLAGELYLYPEWGSVGGYFELSNFDADNRWGAPIVDLTAAGFDVGFRAGVFSANLHGGLRRPERSRFLDSILPPEWSCTLDPQVGAPPSELCIGDYEARHYGLLDLGVEASEMVSIRLGGSLAHTGTSDEIDLGTGFAQLRVVRIADIVDGTLTAEASAGSLLRRFGGRLQVEIGPIVEVLELGLHYGAAAGMLRADQVLYFEQRFGGGVHLNIDHRWRLRALADIMSGGPTSAAIAELELSFRL